MLTLSVFDVLVLGLLFRVFCVCYLLVYWRFVLFCWWFTLLNLPCVCISAAEVLFGFVLCAAVGAFLFGVW